MSRVKVSDVGGFLRNLVPFDAGVLRGVPAWVLTPAATIPLQFRADQQALSAHYMDGAGRTAVGEAVRYYVTSGGTVIAWVTLDGEVHYHPVEGGTAARHLALVKAAWPTSFAPADL